MPFLAAIPALFHELAHSALLHARDPPLTMSRWVLPSLPRAAILPYYALPARWLWHAALRRAAVNWIINIGILCLVIAAYVAYREGKYMLERRFSGVLVIAMVIMVFHGASG